MEEMHRPDDNFEGQFGKDEMDIALAEHVKNIMKPTHHIAVKMMACSRKYDVAADEAKAQKITKEIVKFLIDKSYEITKEHVAFEKILTEREPCL
jgi:hypothetical protein